MLGLGAYQLANRAACESARPLLWLAQDNYQAARGMRAARPGSYGLLRSDDGDDAAAVEWYGDAARSVAAWLARLDGRLAQVPTGTYSAVCGPNEYMPGRGEKDKLSWRSDFETRLCRAVGERKLDYVALNCSVGHLDAEDVATFAPVFRAARWVSYHGYTSPWLVGPDGAGSEFVAEYFWRPLDIWLPQLRRLGIPLRLMLTEVGTYYDWARSGLRGAQPIDYCRTLDGRLAARCQAEGVEYAGAIPFGVGTVGANAAWNLAGCESQLANTNDSFPTVGVIHSKSPASTPVGGKPVADFTSPNHDGPRGRTTGIVVHSTRGGSGSLETELDGTVGWENRPNGDSCHAVVSPTRTAYPVRDDLIAWHCRARNAYTLGIEFCQPKIGDSIPASEVRRGAQVCARWCLKYQIPPAWNLDHGFAQHQDTPEGHADGKTDIGAGFDGNLFMRNVIEEIAKLQTPTPIPVPAVGLNWSEVGTYGNWALARIANKEEPRDEVAFAAHVKAVGGDAVNPWRYGWPVK